MPRSRLQRSVLATVAQVVDDGFQGPVKNQAIVQHADQTGLHGCRQFFPLILSHLGTTAVHEDVLAGSLDKRCQLATQAGVVVALELHPRSEEHTSELQSRPHLVCRLLLEKKKNTNI